jgi:hypothetical protein
VRVLCPIQLKDDLFSYSQLQPNASNEFLSLAFQSSGGVPKFDVQSAEGIHVLDRVVPSRRDRIQIARKLGPYGLKHEATVEDLRSVRVQKQRGVVGA